eukprot:2952503-Pyramimonas_sp.AAC.1
MPDATMTGLLSMPSTMNRRLLRVHLVIANQFCTLRVLSGATMRHAHQNSDNILSITTVAKTKQRVSRCDGLVETAVPSGAVDGQIAWCCC